MKTSAQWWEETKSSPAKLVEWLHKQYTGEVTAAARINLMGMRFNVSTKAKSILAAIADQETQHAAWIGELLTARGETPSIGESENRYWKDTLPGITDFEHGSAVAAHAEKMRLQRIEVISNDPQAPEDIRLAFTKILKDELWHEKAFRSLSTPSALQATLANHEAGAATLGLVA